MRAASLPFLFLLAGVATGLNCLKPMHIDDGVYHSYAAQIADHPFDPYGFQVDAGQAINANQSLAPPVFLYWLALGVRLFGPHPWLWKLWLLPFAFLMVWSLNALYQRFAAGMEKPLLWMTMLAPLFLPSWNLMLDNPAMALSLGALTLFFRGCDRGSWMLAMLAGLTAGVAIETKYTAFTVPVVMLGYSAIYRKLPRGLLAAAVALLVFAVCEWCIAGRYGESHFLCSLRQREGRVVARMAHLALPLLGILGEVAPALGLLGLCALGWPRRAIALAGLIIVAVFVLVACVPEPSATLVRAGATGKEQLTLNNLVFGNLGIGVGAVLAAVTWRLAKGENRRATLGCFERVETFLLLWLGVEMGAYFALSPFPAARRAMGIVAVATIIVGRLASQTCRARPRYQLVRGSAWAGVALGLVYHAVDLQEARAARRAAEDAVRCVRALDPNARLRHYGLFGFKYYAEQAGMAMAAVNLRPGDWLVLGDWEEPAWPGPMNTLDPVAEVTIDDPIPWRTAPCFYGGRTALKQRTGPRFRLRIYRVRRLPVLRQLTIGTPVAPASQRSSATSS
jgi:hypothetical protein